jgi:uncharacterized repeat protein (TIGR01451 family)
LPGRLAAVAAAALVAGLLVPGSGSALQTPKLSVTKSAPSLIDAHDNFAYRITVKNTGDVPLYFVSFRDALPDQVSFKKVDSDPSLTCTEKAKVVTCTVTSTRSQFMQPGDSASATISVQDNVEGPATITNTVDANSTRPAIKDSDTASTDVAAADVAVTKTGPASAFIGDPVVYTLTVVNKGKDRASDVTVTDTLSPLIANVTTPACTPGPGTVTCVLGTIGAGDTRTVQVSGQAAAEGTATDTATLATSSTDTDHTNDSAQATTTITKKPVDLAIAMTVTPPHALVGDPVKYRIVVTNKGPGTGPSTVTDKLPGSMKLLSVSAPCTHAAALVSCALGSLAVGASAAPILVTARAVGAGTVVNRATVKGVNSDPVSTNNATRVTAVVRRPKTTTTTKTTTTKTTTTPTTTAATTTTATTTATTTTTKTTTTKTPVEQPKPKLTLSPPVGPLGTVVHVSGSGFPPNAAVDLRWSKGIGGASLKTGKRGRFEATMLIFQTDVLGPRRLFASPGAGSPPYNVVDARFLVALRALQPADFR